MTKLEYNAAVSLAQDFSVYLPRETWAIKSAIRHCSRIRTSIIEVAAFIRNYSMMSDATIDAELAAEAWPKLRDRVTILGLGNQAWLKRIEVYEEMHKLCREAMAINKTQAKARIDAH